MTDEAPAGAYHEDAARFREALGRTAAVTGFSERLVEKDYFCSVLLQDLAVLFGQGLVFKGGTCLGKVYVEFFRLSEDLDFGVPVSPDATRGQRRRAVEFVKVHLGGVVARLPFLEEAAPFLGHNDSRQYNGTFTYRSLVTGDREAIKVEVSLREELLLPAEERAAKTLLVDPFTNVPVLAPVVVRALALQEAYAEKARAALTRREPAIRDFFDIDCAVRRGLLRHRHADFLSLVARKIALAEDPVDTTAGRMEELARQVQTELKPVLRAADYDEFSLPRVVGLLLEIVAGCGGK